MHDDTDQSNRNVALAHIRCAIAICDGLGDSLIACHLQLGAELLEDKLWRLGGLPVTKRVDN